MTAVGFILDSHRITPKNAYDSHVEANGSLFECNKNTNAKPKPQDYYNTRYPIILLEAGETPRRQPQASEVKPKNSC